jgi:hypothetical protein
MTPPGLRDVVLVAAAAGAIAVGSRIHVSSSKSVCAQATATNTAGSSVVAGVKPPEVGTAVALSKPFQGVCVVAEDEASRSRVYETRDDLLAAYQRLGADYGVTAKPAYVVYLTSEQVTARRLLGRMGQSEAAINAFFAGNDYATGTVGPSGEYSLVYLPHDDGALRGSLAFGATISFIDSCQEPGQADIYPYWFERGLARRVDAKFRRTEDTFPAWALQDVLAGSAPSLASISEGEELPHQEVDAPPASVDARGEAVVSYLERTDGAAAIGRLFRENCPGTIAHFNDVLASITKMNLSQLDNAVSAWLVSNDATETPTPVAGN